MHQTTHGRIDFSGDDSAAREKAQRQYGSFQASANWLLAQIEPHSATLAHPSWSLATRLLHAARQLAWSSAEQERLAEFAGQMLALEGEAERMLAGTVPATPDLAFRLEQCAAQALTHYVAMQSEAARAVELSAASEQDDKAAARAAARADIGDAVRARLDEARAEKVPTEGLELYRVPGFVDAAGCRALVALIERDLFPSGLLGDEKDPEFRTSHSCNLSPHDAPVAEFEIATATLLGYNLRFAETVQGQRYEVGQRFKPHHDFFHKGETYYADVARQGGQRTWTAMLFLNRPEAGGATNFPNARARIDPEEGTLLVWNNMQADGTPNFQSLHEGTPIEAGRKYVLTKWFRERPYL
jgi:prolyl 4-hydroxylase